MEINKPRLSSLQSGTGFADLQPQKDPETVDDQISTDFSKRGNRTTRVEKKDLRRSNKSKQDIFTNPKANEVSESTPISLETTVSQDEQDTEHINRTVSNDSPMTLMQSPDSSAEVHISGLKGFPAPDLESFILTNVEPSESLNEISTGNNVEMSNKLKCSYQRMNLTVF